jgi:hypothetical protein
MYCISECMLVGHPPLDSEHCYGNASSAGGHSLFIRGDDNGNLEIIKSKGVKEQLADLTLTN